VGGPHDVVVDDPDSNAECECECAEPEYTTLLVAVLPSLIAIVQLSENQYNREGQQRYYYNEEGGLD